MARSIAVRAAVGGCVLALAIAAPGFGCGDDRGALMLAVTTDMRAPKDVNVVSVAVQVDGQLKYNFLGRVTPEGEVLLPATLAIVEDNPNATIRIRVIAFKDTKPRVLRDVVTTPPRGGRVALLRMPISFINDDSATGALPASNLPPAAPAAFGGGTLGTADLGGLGPRAGSFDSFGKDVTPACSDPSQTSIDGACASSRIDSQSLPEFAESLVFGDRPGACFDCTKCFKGWREVTVDQSLCVAAKGGDVTNVGLITASTGACDEKGNCYVPIDRADDGWREEGALLHLPKGVCKKVREGSKLVVIGAINEGCTTKTSSLPVCTGPTNAPLAPGDGGVDGSVLPKGEKMVTANLATGVAVYADRLYFGARDGLFLVPNGQSTGTRIAGSPTGPILAPWHVAQLGQTVAFAIGSTIENANDVMGYVLDGANGGMLEPITFPEPVAGRVHGVTLGPSNAFWAASSFVDGEGGVLISGFDGQTFNGLTAPRQVTSVGKVSTGELFVGDASGGVDLCVPLSSVIQCGTPVPLQPVLGPIEGIATTESLATQAFVLRADGIFLATKDGTNPLAVRRLIEADLLGITDVRYHPRGIAAGPKCAFFTTRRGLEYVATDGTTALLADTGGQAAIGVAYPTVAGGGAEQVYFAVRAPADEGGGIYRVKVPASCL
jgi:hypothetical protein